MNMFNTKNLAEHEHGNFHLYFFGFDVAYVIESSLTQKEKKKKPSDQDKLVKLARLVRE